MCSLLYELCASSTSWSNRSFYLFLLTELQSTGFEVHMTTEFIQTLLRSNESITVRCATRLFVLNTPLFVEAIATLRDDEKQAVLEFFTKTAITEATDVVKTAGSASVHDTYSKDIQALLLRNIAMTGSFHLTDHDGISSMVIRNANRNVLWLFKVGQKRWSDLQTLMASDPSLLVHVFSFCKERLNCGRGGRGVV